MRQVTATTVGHGCRAAVAAAQLEFAGAVLAAEEGLTVILGAAGR
ncbi:hypothetical protein [Micromonospora sp. NPDC048898]